jgi:signal transduction histidine kinase
MCGCAVGNPDLFRHGITRRSGVEEAIRPRRRAARQLDLTRALLPIVADYMPVVIENGRFIEFEGDFVWVRINLPTLESIVANLLGNALKAELPGGTIVVRTARGAVIEVVDHGEGDRHRKPESSLRAVLAQEGSLPRHGSRSRTAAP